MDNKRFEQVLGYVKNGKFPSLKNEVLTELQYDILKVHCEDNYEYLKDISVLSQEKPEKTEMPKAKPNGRLASAKPSARTKK